ncbi:rod outer segment membrane protein 1 isoform X2 [Cavia porcellus]|uniref:rod outer segment membrane protein 1 isoform X2 n=1 Tax=Cavia porcellus TaxID=10141 RepID=UPI002FE22852
MAPMLALPLPLGPRVRLAQGLWLLSWLLVLAGSLVLLGAAHLLSQLRTLGAFLPPSCYFLTLPRAALLAGATALGTGLGGAGASQASLDAARYPAWRAMLGPLLLDTEVPGHCHTKWLMDELQLRHQCCGRHGYKDWFGVQWVSSRYLDPSDQDVADRIQSNVEGLYLTDSVPFSCCNPHSPRPCLQSRLSDPYAHPLFDPRQPNLNLWPQGCHEVLLDHLQGLAGTLGSVLAITFLLQVLVLLGLRYLQTALEGLGGVIDGDGDTQGYLLPRGFKDMLKTAWQHAGGTHRPAPAESPTREGPAQEDLPEA